MSEESIGELWWEVRAKLGMLKLIGGSFRKGVRGFLMLITLRLVVVLLWVGCLGLFSGLVC